jgi:protein-tyrosine phosphatase
MQSAIMDDYRIQFAYTVDVPLVSHIDGNLWMGGCIDNVRLRDDFRYVVSLYPWEKYELGPDTERVEFEMYDSAAIPSKALLREIVDQVIHFTDKGQTLVHCQAGMNRSGLVTALTLIRKGWTPSSAIALLRERRDPTVLFNRHFAKWLLRQEPVAPSEP